MIPSPPLPVSSYTQEGLFARRNKDPINLLFGLDSIDVVLGLIEQDPLWCLESLGVSNQVFGEPAKPHVWHVQDINRATKFVSGFNGRMHIRAYALYEDHKQFGRLVAAGIHRESWKRCGWHPGDVVSPQGFDEARDYAVEVFQKDFDVVRIQLPAFAPVVQCNNKVADTDGFAAVVVKRDALRGKNVKIGWDRPLRHA
jgi:hypothetical protein